MCIRDRVNVVHRADAMAQTEQVADGCEHIVHDDGLGDQVMDTGLDGLFHLIARNARVDVYKRQA